MTYIMYVLYGSADVGRRRETYTVHAHACGYNMVKTRSKVVYWRTAVYRVEK